MEKLDKLRTFMMAVEKTNIFVGKMMAYISLVCVAVISFEVIMRYAFNLPTNWGHEMMYSLFAMYYVMVVGVVHYWRAHVRVDVIYAKRSRRTQAILDLINGVFFYIFVFVYIWTSWNFYWSSQMDERGEHLPGDRDPRRGLLHRLGAAVLSHQVPDALRRGAFAPPGHRLDDP